MMQPRRFLEGLQPKQGVGRALHGRSTIIGAMAWMFGLSLLLSFIFGWVPIIGPFIGPIVGGYLGGRRAGSVVRALLAATLPAVFLSLLIFAIGSIAAILADQPAVGAMAVIIAGALWVILIIYNLLLFLSAVIGGFVREIEVSTASGSDRVIAKPRDLEPDPLATARGTDTPQ